MNKENKVFYCYSPSLKKELMNVGERYIAKGVNGSSQRSYWIFLFTDILKDHLDKRPKNNKKINVNIKSPNLN